MRITSRAADVLNQHRAKAGVPESFGIRVYAASEEDGRKELRFAFDEKPASGDKVSESEGTKIFVERQLAGRFADAVIDVHGSELVIRA